MDLDKEFEKYKAEALLTVEGFRADLAYKAGYALRDKEASYFKEVISGYSHRLQALDTLHELTMDQLKKREDKLQETQNRLDTAEKFAREAVNYGELDCKLSDYLATDGVIILTAMHLEEIVDDILKLVKESTHAEEIEQLEGE